ncbi:unnamed protein product [Rhodiola kirilowii]
MSSSVANSTLDGIDLIPSSGIRTTLSICLMIFSM